MVLEYQQVGECWLTWVSGDPALGVEVEDSEEENKKK